MWTYYLFDVRIPFFFRNEPSRRQKTPWVWHWTPYLQGPPPIFSCNIAQCFVTFLIAYTRLYKSVGWSVLLSVGLSVGWLVGQSVGWLVGRSVGHGFVKTAKNGRIHRESLLSPWREHRSRFRIYQWITYSVNHSLKSFIYEPGRIVGLCWPCFAAWWSLHFE